MWSLCQYSTKEKDKGKGRKEINKYKIFFNINIIHIIKKTNKNYSNFFPNLHLLLFSLFNQVRIILFLIIINIIDNFISSLQLPQFLHIVIYLKNIVLEIYD